MTLTELSYYSRRMLPFVIILLLILLIFFYAIKVFFLYLNTQTPVKVSINPIFGKIKKPELNVSSPSAELKYILDTIDGKPVTATDSAQVFFLPQSTSRFGFREKIYLMAKTLGFNTEVTKHTLSEKEATFSEDMQKLTVDISNFNFSYEYDVKKDEKLFLNTNLPEKTLVEEKAIDVLRSVGRYPEELAKGSMTTEYYLYSPVSNRYTVAKKIEDANVVEVNFYRSVIAANPQEISIVSPKYFSSQNHVIMVFNEEGGFKLIKAQVKLFEKSQEQIGIYPLITGDDAFNMLQEGKAMIISYSQNGGEILIKKMFLSYLDPEENEEYLQPVYVFWGENDFVGYVPAITSEYFIE